MNVGELIEALSKVDPSLPVHVNPRSGEVTGVHVGQIGWDDDLRPAHGVALWIDFTPQRDGRSFTIQQCDDRPELGEGFELWLYDGDDECGGRFYPASQFADAVEIGQRWLGGTDAEELF